MKTLEDITTTYVDNLRYSIIRVKEDEKDSLQALGFDRKVKAIKYTRGDIPMVTIFNDEGDKYSWRISNLMPEEMAKKHERQNQMILEAIEKKTYYKC